MTCRGLPFGGAPIGVSVEALRDVCSWKLERDTQGWGKYFTESGRYRVETIEAEEAVRRPDYRMTLDYPCDLSFFRAAVAQLGHGSPPLESVVALLDRDRELAEMGSRMTDEYWRRFEREHGSFVQ